MEKSLLQYEYREALRKGVSDVQAALDELMGALDFKYPLAGQLYPLYSYCKRLFSTVLYSLDVYIITGLLGTIVAAFLVYFMFGVEMGFQVSISYMSNSLFLALAATFPDVQFLLFFIIPVKAKWMAPE